MNLVSARLKEFQGKSLATVLTATILTIFTASTKVAAFGRHDRRGGFGRATSFVVSFVLALNRVNVVAVTTLLVLHVAVIGHHVPCHYDFVFYAVRTMRVDGL